MTRSARQPTASRVPALVLLTDDERRALGAVLRAVETELAARYPGVATWAEEQRLLLMLEVHRQDLLLRHLHEELTTTSPSVG